MSGEWLWPLDSSSVDGCFLQSQDDAAPKGSSEEWNDSPNYALQQLLVGENNLRMGSARRDCVGKCMGWKMDGSVGTSVPPTSIFKRTM